MGSLDLVEISCPICGSDQSQYVYPARDYVHRITADLFGVRRCDACGGGFLSPRPAAADIGKYYPAEFYWSFENAAGQLPAAELLRRRSPQIEEKLRCMAHLKPGRLLDVGAMKGEFLHVARERGWRVEGVEFTELPVNMFGVPVRYGEFLEMDFEPGSVDCVTMWAVLEHVYDPRAYVTKIAGLLAKGGTFLGVATNFNSLQSRWLRADDFPRHLTMFTKRSLRAMLQEAGLRPVRMWTDQRLFGGALRGLSTYYAKRMLGYSVDDVLYEMRDREDPLAFCCKFRSKPSRAVKFLNKIDSLLLRGPEWLLDRAGLGFNLGFEARKD